MFFSSLALFSLAPSPLVPLRLSLRSFLIFSNFVRLTKLSFFINFHLSSFSRSPTLQQPRFWTTAVFAYPAALLRHRQQPFVPARL